MAAILTDRFRVVFAEKFIAKKLNMNFWDLTLDSEKYFEHIT